MKLHLPHLPQLPNCDRACRERAKGALMTSATFVGAIVAAVALLAGCASPGPAVAPKAAMSATDAGASATDTPWPAAAWWTAWGDTALPALIDTALARQPALQAVQARLVQAQAAADVADAARAPQLSGSIDLSDQRFTKNGIIPPPLAGALKWNNSAQIGAGWELDLFGRQRAALDAAIGQLNAGRADAQAARVLLAANVASAYVNLARLVDAREIADEAIAQREQVLVLVRQRISAGLDTTVELRQAEGFIAQTRTEREALDEAIVRGRHALAELTGQGPDALASLAPRLAPVKGIALPSALPADLLGRRADLVAQSRRR
jgi:NodT family efflux transporter outer membrane factor (OMF) lipoprotein